MKWEISEYGDVVKTNGNMWSKGGKKIKNKEFDFRISKDYPNIKRLSNYINTKTPINFCCVRCGKIYKKKPKEISRINCKCLDREKKYKDRISDKKIKVLENYINARTKILHRCEECLLEFKSAPKTILNSKYGCPSCSGKIFSIEKYKSMLPDNIKLLSTEYVGSSYKHDHICNDCGTKFSTKPNYILHMKTNCPVCSKSKGERQIIDFLKSIEVKYEKEFIVEINKKNLRFDFYIEELRTFIEYDGVQHFKPVEFFGGEEYYKDLLINDELKNKWCVQSGYNLIRISYNDDVFDYLSYIFS